MLPQVWMPLTWLPYWLRMTLPRLISEDVNAPLVTIALDEAALTPAVLLLRYHI